MGAENVQAGFVPFISRVATLMAACRKNHRRRRNSTSRECDTDLPLPTASMPSRDCKWPHAGFEGHDRIGRNDRFEPSPGFGALGNETMTLPTRFEFRFRIEDFGNDASRARVFSASDWAWRGFEIRRGPSAPLSACSLRCPANIAGPDFRRPCRASSGESAAGGHRAPQFILGTEFIKRLPPTSPRAVESILLAESHQ